jgi:GTPase
LRLAMREARLAAGEDDDYNDDDYDVEVEYVRY